MANNTNKIINTSSPDTQKEQPSPDLTLSPLSEPTPAVKRDPVTKKDGDIIRIDY